MIMVSEASGVVHCTAHLLVTVCLVIEQTNGDNVTASRRQIQV